jgi:uncharacterized protein (TIGR02099 family)
VFHWLKRTTRQLIFSLLLLIAILFSTTRVLFYYADLYKSELQTQLSAILETPVRIGKISASMRGLHPQLRLQDISLAAKSLAPQPALTVKEIRLSLNLLDVWRKPQWQLATSVSLVGLRLTLLHRPDGSVVIEGLKTSNGEPSWLLQGNHYTLLQSDITWREQDRPQQAIQFKQVDVLLKNDLGNTHHQLHILSQTPNAITDRLRVSIDFVGNPFQPNTLTANFYAQVNNLHFESLVKKWLPEKWRLQARRSDAELWGTWQNAHLRELTGQLTSRHVRIQRADQKKLQFKRVASQFSWQNQANRWILAMDNLHLALQNQPDSPMQWVIGSRDKTAQHIAIKINQLDLSTLTTLGQFFAPLASPGDAAWLSALTVKGQLRASELFVDLATHHYALRGQFKHLFVSSLTPALQLQNLSGVINGTDQQGTLYLDTLQANFVAQNLFRTPLKINRLQGKLSWWQTDKNWQLGSENLALDTPYARSNHQLKLIIPKNQQPTFIDLNTTFSGLAVNRAKVYFPTTLMRKGLVDYLDKAFIAGQATNGKMLLYGNLVDFPFRQHQGVFQILFDAHNVTMNYAPQWPLFEQLEARVMFLNDSVEIEVQRAMARRAMLYATKIRIPSFHDSDYLLAQGKVRALINDGLDFLRYTPLQLPLTALAEQVTFAGTTQVGLDLQIALTDNVQSKVLGTATLNDAKLKVLAVNLPITQVNGDLKFTEQRFYSDTLEAEALGHPITAKISQNTEQTQIEVDGTVGIADLQQQFSLANQKVAQGLSPYQLTLSLPVAEKAAAQLQIQSTLQGISLNLPDGLAKTTAEKREFALGFTLGDEDFLPISLNYADRLKAAIKWHKVDKKLVAGAVLLGAGSVEMPANTGLKVKFNQPSFTPLAWLGLLDKTQSPDTENPLLTELEIHTQQLLWQEASLGAMDLKLHHANEDWSGEINCAAMTGRLQWLNNPRNENKYIIQLEQLDLSSLLKFKLPTKQAFFTGTQLPLMEISSDKVLFNGVELGRFELSSQRFGTGVKFPKISLTARNRKLNLTGDWQLQNGKTQTRLSGQLSAERFGSLLRKLELYKDFKETHAEIGLALHWQGAPYQVSLAGLNGSVDVNLTDGRILSIEPGFGRVLGILAMRQWIKRLQLDFGDVYKEGLSFDSISGHFTVTNGKAVSHDLTVDAVAATINLIGEVDLGEQTLNQEIAVIPKSSDAVPIAGIIVGNIATVVTQTLTGEYEDGYYLRSKYKVKGKWNDLNVTSLYEQDGLLHKIGRGLTDFSWEDEPK